MKVNEKESLPIAAAALRLHGSLLR